jgi:hypothetical protein
LVRISNRHRHHDDCLLGEGDVLGVVEEEQQLGWGGESGIISSHRYNPPPLPETNSIKRSINSNRPNSFTMATTGGGGKMGDNTNKGSNLVFGDGAFFAPTTAGNANASDQEDESSSLASKTSSFMTLTLGGGCGGREEAGTRKWQTK